MRKLQGKMPFNKAFIVQRKNNKRKKKTTL